MSDKHLVMKMLQGTRSVDRGLSAFALGSAETCISEKPLRRDGTGRFSGLNNGEVVRK